MEVYKDPVSYLLVSLGLDLRRSTTETFRDPRTTVTERVPVILVVCEVSFGLFLNRTEGLSLCGT